MQRFMRGIFNRRPQLPRYVVTWNPQTVLNFLKDWDPPSSLSLKELSLKAAFLLTLLSARRGSTIVNLHIRNINIFPSEIHISIGDLTKTSKLNRHSPEIILPSFEDKSLCIVNFLKAYLERTSKLRGNHLQLFISFQQPHKPISRDTLSRWIRQIMEKAGIDLGRFKPHSLRSAATSAASSNNVSLGTILASVGWRSESTFATFYKKPLERNTGEVCSTVQSL